MNMTPEEYDIKLCELFTGIITLPQFITDDEDHIHAVKNHIRVIGSIKFLNLIDGSSFNIASLGNRPFLEIVHSNNKTTVNDLPILEKTLLFYGQQAINHNLEIINPHFLIAEKILKELPLTEKKNPKVIL